MTAQVDLILDELAQLAGVIESFAALEPSELSPEWMALESLRRRDLQLRHELGVAQGTAELEIRLVGGAERDSTVEAGFLAELLRSFQGALAAVVQVIQSGETERGPHAAVVQTSSAVRMAPAAAGSFVILLEGPVRAAAITMEGEEEVPAFDEAVARILDVLDSAPADPENGDRAGIVQAISDMGSHRALSHVSNLTAALAVSGTAVSVVDRTPFRPTVREVRVTSRAAAAIREVASQTHQTTATIRRRGRLTGVRWRRATFDLEVPVPDPAGGPIPLRIDVISGRVVSDIRGMVQAAFDREVEAIIERTTTETDADRTERIAYRLIGIEVVEPGG